MKITMNSSCSTQKDFITRRPINGKTTIDKNKIKGGVWTSTIAIADTSGEKCTGTASAGQTCTRYGSGGSGGGIVVQKSVVSDGGTSAAPYTQEIITITGASNV